MTILMTIKELELQPIIGHTIKAFVQFIAF